MKTNVMKSKFLHLPMSFNTAMPQIYERDFLSPLFFKTQLINNTIRKENKIINVK